MVSGSFSRVVRPAVVLVLGGGALALAVGAPAGSGASRDVVSGPDGYLYVSLEPGRVARLVPAVGAVETR